MLTHPSLRLFVLVPLAINIVIFGTLISIGMRPCSFLMFDRKSNEIIEEFSSKMACANLFNCRFILSGRIFTVYGCRFTPDGKCYASAGDDGTIRFWTFAPEAAADGGADAPATEVAAPATDEAAADVADPA
mgnify:CR=1 FL=1